MSSKHSLYKPGQQEGPTEFELNPLISEIVLWNDAEILDRRPEFAKLNISTRVALICGELFFNGVAKVEFEPIAIWLPTDDIEHNCGGSNIVPRSHYALAAPVSPEESRKLKKAMKEQLRRRLKFIVRMSVLAFQAYNSGFNRIDGIDDIGMLRWRPTDAGLRVSGGAQRRVN
jgi:hypothetical protein